MTSPPDSSPPEQTAPPCPTAPMKVPDVQNLVGLALSGGGIRSASFNLGVLQGLAETGVLWIFDYVSTVSGGGFVGAWWTAWLTRKKAQEGVFPGNEELEPERREKTARLLDLDVFNTPTAASDVATARHQAGRAEAAVLSERNDPIHFLRTFSNYLTPRTGWASADTWRLIVWYVRSLLFTWAALLPLACASILFAQTFYLWNPQVARAFVCTPPPALIEAVNAAPVATRPLAISDVYRGNEFCRGENPLRTDWQSTRLEYLARLVAAFVVAGLTLALLWLIHSSAGAILATTAIGVTVTTVVLVIPIFRQSVASSFSWPLASIVWLILVLHGRRYLVARSDARKASATGPRVKVTAADLRSWLTQQQARLLKFGTVVLFVLLIAGFAHDVGWFLFSGSGSVLAATLRRSAGWGGLLLSVASAAYTAIKASPSTVYEKEAAPSRFGRLLISIAPPLVVLALTLALATASHALIVKTLTLPGNVLILANAIVWFALLEVVLAFFESSRDPDTPADEGTLLKRLVPWFIASAIAWFTARAIDRDRWKYEAGNRPWYYLFSPRGWVRIGALAGLLTILGLARIFSWSAARAAVQTGFGTLASLLVLALAVAITWVPRQWPLALRSARPVVLLVIASATAVLAVLSNGGIANRAQGSPLLAALLWIGLLVGSVIGLGWLADPNLLSMHGFYKGRLTRAYLGASNTARGNAEITEAAPGDDINLSDTWNHAVGAPYHIINTTLSLVGGSDLATAQRSAENFIMTKYHCGSARAGYRCTSRYMSGELTLGTAAAVSGAAVSPTMGTKKASAALTLLLSLMAVRLGFWAPTPAGRRWNDPHARLWPFYLLRETLANTGKIGTYCYLTDGGHFDNTGLYALIERGCRYIVCCDCGADPGPSFDDIGTAIRRCRIDFGTEVSLDLSKYAKAKKRELSTGLHVVKGEIRYQESHLRLLGLDAAERSRRGVLLWIKPIVRERDPADIQQYKLECRDFPQESTADQWYDESQFESYRRLGYESAREAFQAKAPETLERGEFQNIHTLF